MVIDGFDYKKNVLCEFDKWEFGVFFGTNTQCDTFGYDKKVVSLSSNTKYVDKIILTFFLISGIPYLLGGNGKQ